MRRPRLAVWVATSLLVLLVGVGLIYPLWLPLPASWLAVRDTPAPSDVIVVLSGRASERGPVAAALFRSGLAPVVVTLGGRVDALSNALGTPWTEAALNGAILRRHGVPAEAILELPRGRSTWEEALAFRELALARRFRTVLLVTSVLHARRARWAFRRALDGQGIVIRVTVSPPDAGALRRWWEQEEMAVGVLVEYLKLAYYLWHY